MKYVIVIGDGMADNPVEALGGKTPLEYAKKPVIDSLSASGELGHVLTVPRGIAPGSDTAILSIFGYDPREYFSGRSPFEAASSGIALDDGDISYRCNMVALEDCDKDFRDKKILSHSGGSIEGDKSIELLGALLADSVFAGMLAKNRMKINPIPSFRHIAVQKGADIAGLVAIPPHDHLGEVIGGLLPSGIPLADELIALMRRANEVLDKHPVNEERRAQGKLPANGIWFWAEGKAVAIPSFVKKYGKSGFVVSGVPLAMGIGALAGLRFVIVPGATGELDTDFEGKTDAIINGLLDGADFAVLHIEAPDECTHNGDLDGKILAIEWLDSRSVSRLVEGLKKAGEDFRMLIISDHKTLTSTRGHDGDPVPYILYDSRKASGSGLAYTEANAAKGPYIGEGHKLIEKLFEMA